MNSSTNPNNEFITFITRALKEKKDYISATNLCGLMLKNIPKQFYPPKGQFNKWMSSIKNLEKNDNKDKDMPFYKWKEDKPSLEINSNVKLIIDNIKTTFILWQKKIKFFRYPQHNMRMWNKLHSIFTENNNYKKIIQDNFPNYIDSIKIYCIDKMPEKPTNYVLDKTNTINQKTTNEQVRLISNQQNLPVSNPQSLPVSNPQNLPVSNQQSLPVSNQQSLPVSNQQIPPIQLRYTSNNPNNSNLQVNNQNYSDKPIGPPPGLGFDELHNQSNLHEPMFVKPQTSILFPSTNNNISYENQHSLLFPNKQNNFDSSYQYTNLLNLIKQLDLSDVIILNNFREILKNYQSSNLVKLLNEIHKIKNL